MKKLVVAEDITKKFGNFTALNKISMDIPEGSIYGLLGPNGAGKTTLLRIINQIIFPDQGKLIFDGDPLIQNHIKDIGYLPEERGLYKSMKVGEQALYLARLKGLSKAEAKKQLIYWFDRLEIGDWWNKKIQQLSKGMAQKIQFVVTVLHKPKLLIFDEPFSGFDPINANQIKAEILRLKQQGTTVIFSTHRMESVEEICDHIMLIDKSNKLIEGSLSEIKRQHRTNTYQLGINTENENTLLASLKEKFLLSQASFNSPSKGLKTNIHLGDNESPNQLLSYLTTKGQIFHFTELIPSVNDIFIKTVNSHQV